MTDRGQTFTLEAFVAAILLLSTVAFALQAASVSANTASAAETELGNQRAGLAVGVVDQSAANGTLRTTLLYWDDADGEFHNAEGDDGQYIARSPPTVFGDSLSAMFDDTGVRYNVDLYYPTAVGDRERQRLVESGTPADDAIRVVETVTLYDDTNLVHANGTQQNATVGNTSFYAPDAASTGPTYNVIRVEVVLWET